MPSISTTVPLYFAKCSADYHITCEWSRNYYPCKKNVKKRGVGVPFSDVPQITHMPSESCPPAFNISFLMSYLYYYYPKNNNFIDLLSCARYFT